MKLRWKLLTFVALLPMAGGILQACDTGSSRACAATLYGPVLYKGASGGSSSGYHAPSNSGASKPASGSSSGGYKAPSNSGAGGTSGKISAPSNSGSHPASTPTGGVPSKISGSNYTYHGTNGVTHLYTYHPESYWMHLGPPDPYNPFDSRNFLNPFSPYYHRHIAC